MMQFECCGWTNYTDWINTTFFEDGMLFPMSCECDENGDGDGFGSDEECGVPRNSSMMMFNQTIYLKVSPCFMYGVYSVRPTCSVILGNSLLLCVYCTSPTSFIPYPTPSPPPPPPPPPPNLPPVSPLFFPSYLRAAETVSSISLKNSSWCWELLASCLLFCRCVSAHHHSSYSSDSLHVYGGGAGGYCLNRTALSEIV